MTLYLYSAWALALLFSAIVGAWTGGTAALALGVSALFAGTIVLQAVRSRGRAGGPAAAGAALPDGAAELCEAVSAPAAVVEGRSVIEANRAFLALLEFGGRRGQVVGLPITNLVHPLDQGRLAALLAASARGAGDAAPETLRLVKADGGTIRMQVCASPLGAVPDTQLLQLGPDAAAASRPRGPDISSVVLAQLDLVVVSVDPGGEMTYVNRAWERLAGNPQVDVRGRQFRAYLHPVDRDAVSLEFSGILHGRLEHLMREVRLVGADGSVHWMDLRAHPCVLADGEVIGVLATLNEITPRKKVEESATASRRLPTTLLANFPGMVYRSRNDDEWTMDFVSDGSLELTGFEPFELVKNARTSWARLIHPDDREFVRQQVQASVAQRKPFRMTYRIVDAQGKESWVWEQGRGVFSATGEVLALEGFITDVRMRTGAEEQTMRRLDMQLDIGPADRAQFDQWVSYLLHHAAAAHYPCALLWVEIDEFERTCAQIGPRGADQALAILADRFGAVQGPGTAVTWLGAGQFAVLLTDFRLGGAQRAVPEVTEIMPACSSIAGRLTRAIASPFALDGGQWSMTASIGIALSNAGYQSAEAMIAAARNAAREARERMGPGQCEFADE
jgi:PAS domain S-box-containing protein